MLKHFSDDSIREILEKKRVEFLNLSFEAYKKANSKVNHEHLDNVEDEIIEIIDPASKQDESSSHSSSNERSNQDQKRKTNAKHQATSQVDYDNSEEWFHHYMLGKIKEKIIPFGLLTSLEHYKQVNKRSI